MFGVGGQQADIVLLGQSHVLPPAYCLGPGDAEDDGYQTIRVPEGVIGRLEETWVAQHTRGDVEEAAASWKEQLQNELQSTSRIAEGWNALQRKT